MLRVKNLLTSQSGMTLPELLIVMVLTVLFSGLIMQFSLDLWGTSGSLQNSSDTLQDRQNLGDTIRNRLNEASSLINQNSIADTYPGKPDPTDATGQHWLLIHAEPKTIALPATNSIEPVLYYTAPSVSTAKTYLQQGTTPYLDEFIIYIKGGNPGTLWLRTLVNPSTSTNRYKTSCPNGNTTSTCPEDKLLASNVSGVSLRYFSKSGNSLNWNAVKDPITGASIGPDFPSVEVVEISVSFSKKAMIKGTADSKSNTIIRVALRNG